MRERQIRRFGEDVRASAPESSGPFATAVAARQQVGRLVKVLWKTNRELPRYFMAQPGRVVDIGHEASISHHAHPR
jgi:hypothetical protein